MGKMGRGEGKEEGREEFCPPTFKELLLPVVA